VPIARIVQLQKRRRDHPSTVTASEQPMGEEELTGAFCGEVTAFVSG
jgi:hypothetical protein